MTPTDIANLALDILKEATITSLDEDRPIARWAKRNFSVTRDALLERWEWNFAVKLASLPVDSATPAFGWGRSFTVPADCIRVLPLTCDGAIEGRPIPHEVIGRKIYTDDGSPLKLRYIFRNEDTESYPATFVEALAARLAVKSAHWMTGKSNYVQIADGLYNDAISTAWAVDAITGTWPRASDSEWTNAR